MDIFHFLDDIAKNAKEAVFFEVGTHDGYHTNMINNVIKKYHSSYRYFAFEPDRRSHGDFQNYARNHLSNINFSFSAIGAQIGQMEFHLSDGYETRDGHTKQRFNGSSSIKRPKHVLTAWPDMKFTPIIVDVTTIEEVCKTNNIDHIDFIWADVQGAEEDLIRGFRSMKPRIHYLYTEYCDGELYENEFTLKQIGDLLGKKWEIVHDFGGDVLFRNKAYANTDNYRK